MIVGAEGGDRWIGGTDRQIRALVLSPFVSHRLRPFVVSPKFEDLVVLKELIEAGKVTPVIDRTYPLSETPEAIRYLEEGHARGKVLINVRGEPERKTLVTPQAARMSPATIDQVPADCVPPVDALRSECAYLRVNGL